MLTNNQFIYTVLMEQKKNQCFRTLKEPEIYFKLNSTAQKILKEKQRSALSSDDLNYHDLKKNVGTL